MRKIRTLPEHYVDVGHSNIAVQNQHPPVLIGEFQCEIANQSRFSDTAFAGRYAQCSCSLHHNDASRFLSLEILKIRSATRSLVAHSKSSGMLRFRAERVQLRLEMLLKIEDQTVLYGLIEPREDDVVKTDHAVA